MDIDTLRIEDLAPGNGSLGGPGTPAEAPLSTILSGQRRSG